MEHERRAAKKHVVKNDFASHMYGRLANDEAIGLRIAFTTCSKLTAIFLIHDVKKRGMWCKRTR